MSKSSRAVVPLTIVLAGCLSAGAASAVVSTVVFQGLKHTAVGTAMLRLDAAAGALVVDPLDPGGRDGVAVELGEATHWSARTRVTADRARPAMLSWNAMADGVRISTATMRLAGDGVALGASFTGGTESTYSAQVYRDGRLVGAVGSV